MVPASSENDSGSYSERKEIQPGAPPNLAKGTTLMVHTMIESMCVLFIVSHVNGTMSFYTGEPGFKSSYKEPVADPFFAVVGRDGASPFVKAGKASPLPRPNRDPTIRWDTYSYTPDPNALAAIRSSRSSR